MNAQMDNPEVCKYACGTLKNIVFECKQKTCALFWHLFFYSILKNTAANREIAVEADAIPAVITAIEKHSNIIEVCESGCDAIRAMTSNSKINK